VRLSLEANLEALESGQAALASFLDEAGASEKTAYNASLAFEELVSNVMRHAYPSGHGPIDVSVELDGAEVILTVEDQGRPFNPLLAEEPAKPASVEEAQIGGWGISLVRMAATNIEYRRIDSRNRVRVRIRNS